MRIAISSATQNKTMRIDRKELVSDLIGLGNEVVLLGPDSNGDIHDDYKRYGVEFGTIEIDRVNTNPIKEIISIKKIYRVLKEKKIDVLISYGIRSFPTMMIASKFAKVKTTLCVVNGSGRLFQLSGFRGLLVKAISYPMLIVAFLISDNILFQNRDDMEMINKKLLLWKKNFDTINGSGVNLEEYKLTKLEESDIFLMVSRITGSKGVNEYLYATENVKKIYPNAEFYLVGHMDNMDHTVDIDKLNYLINNNIINFVNGTNDIKSYISKSRYFILPSYYPEGVPRAVLEAMSMGRPIITTNSPGCKECVVEGENGFLVDPKAVDQLTEKMIWMMDNKEIVNEMGLNSRKLCESKFDINKINKKMIEKLGV
ncbi:glycosyltransferase family 4 protein [Terrisporobacter mayombei]|uniref:glycosyltransferase family 4 protein n=1 Tax=Terrisporobacter mayombei TaxID=1541 RepID=UPI002659966C|nr:glycosyltransferase family 4 protein [Terrisporobacter mayombei]MCC3670627.1 glycosyltransferase family 4 protein [Terrisporobacter mayombei]